MITYILLINFTNNNIVHGHNSCSIINDVRCRKTLDDSDIVDVKLYECTRTQYIESTDDNRDDMMT